MREKYHHVKHGVKLIVKFFVIFVYFVVNEYNYVSLEPMVQQGREV